MAGLYPCPDCSRHVRADEERCPFCEAELSAAPLPRATPGGRLGRAALMAVGVTVAVATVGAVAGCCGKRNDHNVQKPYGAPPADGLFPEIV